MESGTRLISSGVIMLLVRRIGALILAVAAISIWFVLEPEKTSANTPDYSSAISSAVKNYKVNNAAAESAPQQEVVNGWLAKDLLEIIAMAQNASLSPESAPRDDRVPAELLLLVLGVALLALTSRGDASGHQQHSPTPGSVQPVGAAPASASVA